ncbi:hypothetical protein [Jeotgalibacillus haloalkalitolerans]|uniref:Uncharacterized protein n=1 Tax=Jeotgalibacillus haloalkalitolerans TaxID=3104292 RepID=A0ABU5KNC2_9BACL|nr:hypothetical protein [Jeotgalibacillus sp. HH7-29]MDZ5712760.1 hypothetical protein [Jeotgalibacillus sp. HH7-29]
MYLLALIAIIIILFISSITVEKYLKEHSRQNEEIIRILNEIKGR